MTETPRTAFKPMIEALERRLMLDASLPAIAGNVLWLDAADASTVLDADGDNAATGTGGANNGFSGGIATWQDKSGSNFHVSAPTAGERPSYTTAGRNGLNTITFDGGTDRLINASASIPGNDYSAFIVFNRTVTGGRDGVFELGSAGSRNALFINETGNGRLNYYINGTFFNSSSLYTTGTYELVAITHDSTTYNLWRAGVNDVSGTGGTARAATTGIYVGDDSSSGDQLQGNIAELIVYDRDLTSLERRDVENYLATKWGFSLTNVNPVLATNAGATVSQGDPVTLTSAMLSSTDADNSASLLRYTINDLADYGSLRNTNTAHIYALGESFTQGDIDNGYITYTHDNSANFSDLFGFTLSDGYYTSAAQTFSLTVTPDNQAPVIKGWTLVSSENFESGATGWNNNTTTAGGAILTRYLGRFSNDAGLQTNFKTYSLSGTQDEIVISFDFYELDTWDTEAFRIFVNDAMVFNYNFTGTVFDAPPDGSSGQVSWTIQQLTPFLGNAGSSASSDQLYRVTLNIGTTASTVKLGFGSLTNQSTSDESWGIDNVSVYEVRPGGAPGPLSISEVAGNGETLGTDKAYDPDGDTVSYSITGGTGAGVFAINASTGVIAVLNASSLDYETTPSYTLIVRATDNGTGALFDSETITINVIDAPENTTPVIPAGIVLNVPENAAAGTLVGTVNGADAEGNTLTYAITAGNTNGLFAINAATGEITIANPARLNYEFAASHTLTIRATDNGFGALNSVRNIVINVQNLNERPGFNDAQRVLAENPQLVYSAASGNFYRYVSTPANFAGASATASASMLNGVSGYIATITSAAENTLLFNLMQSTIWIGASDAAVEGEWRWVSGPEAGQLFWIGSSTGSAQNGFYTNWRGGEPNSNGSENHVELLAVLGTWNDNNGAGTRHYYIEWTGADVLAHYNSGAYTVAENSAAGTVAGSVNAADPDSGDVLSYSITGGTGASLFAIDSATGVITLTGAADYEASTSYTLNLRVQDSGGLFDTKTITINITDVNDAPTGITMTGGSVAENSAPGTLVATLSAVDDDASDTHSYTLVTNPGGLFSIAGNELRLNGAVNYEVQDSYTLDVRVEDNGGLFETVTLTINVTDANDIPTGIGVTGGNVAENSAVGTVVAMFSTADEDAGDTHVYSLVTNPGGKFTIVGNELRTNGAIDYETDASFAIVVRADDGRGGIVDLAMTVQVDDVVETVPSPPPPAPPASTGGLSGYFPLREEEPSSYASLLQSGLQGESAYIFAFYGEDGHQILRENISFLIRDILPDGETAVPVFSAFIQGELIALDESEFPERRVPDFTNLREALSFLQQMAGDEKHDGGKSDPSDDARASALPPSALDRRFVDVMTYHQERAARLREALLETA